MPRFGRINFTMAFSVIVAGGKPAQEHTSAYLSTSHGHAYHGTDFPGSSSCLLSREALAFGNDVMVVVKVLFNLAVEQVGLCIQLTPRRP